MGRTLLQKVWDAHVVEELPGDNALLAIDRIIAIEITTPQPAAEIAERFGDRLFDASSIVAIIDHISPAKDTETAIQAQALRKWAKAHDVVFYDVGNNGICHVVIPERGWVEPGITLICGDSHTCTHGAFGAFALGIGSSVQCGAMLAGAIIQKRPKVIRINVEGKLHPGATAKDLALTVISTLGFQGGTGAVLEYHGSAIRALSMEERMTLCNMAIEAGATTGMIEPDETTIEYLRGREAQPKGEAFEKKAAFWRTLRADPDAVYVRTLDIDASKIRTVVSWGTNPGESVSIDSVVPNGDASSLEYMDLKPGTPMRGIEIDQAFIGSCTNARISDLRAAAEIFKGRKVAVPTIVTPGSQAVKRQAEREGLHDVFQDAGALWTHSSCGPCLGMSMGVVAPGMRIISSTNRNFRNRMGTGGRVHLATPVVVAASAILGRIGTPDELPVEVPA
ncbi:MAG TPA: homoaconitate hydratase family protein [Candidatus Baltobacteraceae bacterium]|jgi:3-isopropylmalate/(R)-2-methylmalate dehydratase large subunit